MPRRHPAIGPHHGCSWPRLGLLGRNVDGVEIFWFDTSVGQWRPQADANGVCRLLTSTDASGDAVSDFAQSQESDPHSLALPQYYSKRVPQPAET